MIRTAVALIALSMAGCVSWRKVQVPPPTPPVPSLAYAEDHLNYMWTKFFLEDFYRTSGRVVVSASFEIEQVWGIDNASVLQRECVSPDGRPTCGVLWIRPSATARGEDGPHCPTGATGRGVIQ